MKVVNSDECDWSRPALLLIGSGKTLPHVWRIPLVVGTVLTVANQYRAMMSGDVAAVMMAATVNVLTPFVVASLGFIAARRTFDSGREEMASSSRRH